MPWSPASHRCSRFGERGASAPGNGGKARRMTTAAVPIDRLGDILLREGLLSRDKLVHALAEHRSSGMPLGYILAKQGLVPEVEITRIVARQLRVPAVDLTRYEVDPKIIKLIPADIAKRHIVLPLKREGRTLTVAMSNPT